MTAITKPESTESNESDTEYAHIMTQMQANRIERVKQKKPR